MGVEEAEGRAGGEVVEVVGDGEVGFTWEGHEVWWGGHCGILWGFCCVWSLDFIFGSAGGLVDDCQDAVLVWGLSAK